MPKHSPRSTVNADVVAARRSARSRACGTGAGSSSLTVVWRWCGSRNAFETCSTSIAGAITRAPRTTATRAGRATARTTSDEQAEADRSSVAPGRAVDVRRGDRLRPADDDRADVLHHLHDRADERDRLRPRRQEADRVDDRRREEEQLDDQLPELGHVAQPHERRVASTRPTASVNTNSSTRSSGIQSQSRLRRDVVRARRTRRRRAG